MLLTSISTEGRISSQNRTWLCHLTAGLRPARPPTLGLGRYIFRYDSQQAVKVQPICIAWVRSSGKKFPRETQ